MDVLQYLLNFGLGAVFAGIMFYIYRCTRDQMRKDREFMESRLIGLVEDYKTTILSTSQDYKDVVRERNDVMLKFVTVITELTVWLQARNGVKKGS